MTPFELVRQEVTENNPFLRDVYEKFTDRIRIGEYPSNELTEDKIVNLLVEFAIEREENSTNRHRFPKRSEWLMLHDHHIESYFNVLWVVLEENLCCYSVINPMRQRELKQRFDTLYHDAITSEN